MPVTGSLYRGNPCSDCQPPKRRTGCHGECPEYKEWSDTVKERKDLYWKDKKERTIKELDEEEKNIKERMITAVKRKRFPVDAKKLVNNYFGLAKRDPDKAYETLITNPLFFSPILLEQMPKKFFGLIKPSAKDAIAVNKQMAAFFKSLKV